MTARAIAPSITLLILTTNAIVMKWLQIGWWHPTTLILIGAEILAAYAIARALGLEQVLDNVGREPSPLWNWPTALTTAVAVAAALIMYPALGLNYQVPQHSDSLFHLNGVWSMLNYRDASPFTGLGPLYGVEPRPTTYAAAWHQWLSLVATSDRIIPTTNAALALLPVVWLAQMMAFTSIALKRSPRAVAALPLVVLIAPSMPIALTNVLSRWPNALMLTVLPGVAALFCLGWRQSNVRWRTWLLAMIGWTGAMCAHFSAGVTLWYLFFPLIAYLFVTRLARALHTPREPRLAAGLMAAVAGITAFICVNWWTIRGFLSYHHVQSANWSWWGGKILGLLRLYHRTDGTILTTLALNALVPLTVIGLVVAYKRGECWLVSCYLAFALLTYSSTVPIPLLTIQTGWWFSDAIRMMGILSILGLPLCALGLDALTAPLSRLHKRTRKACIALGIVITVASALPLRAELVRSLYDPTLMGTRQLDPGELELQRRLADIVKPGERVLGEAANGSALLPITAGVDVALKQQNYASVDWSGRYLRRHFKEYATDPAVCSIINRSGIRYFYDDPQRYFTEHDLVRRSPGLFNVFTGPGFELVSSSGKIAIWRITYCDNIPNPYQPPWYVPPARQPHAYVVPR